MGNGERELGTWKGSLEPVYSGNPPVNSEWRTIERKGNKRKCSGCRREFLPAVPPDDPNVFVTLEGEEKKIKSVLSQATPIGQTTVGLK